MSAATAATACTLAGLRACQRSCVQSLVNQLQQKGFALVSIDPSKSGGSPTGIHRDNADHHQLRQTLERSIAVKNNNINNESSGSFRFPPLEAPVVYTPERQAAFRSLFDVALTTLGALLAEYEDSSLVQQPCSAVSSTTSSTTTTTAIAATTLSKDVAKWRNALNVTRDLFGNHPNVPFSSLQQPGVALPFDQTFFNLFDYNHGLLNCHVDRGLVTVAYASEPFLETNDDSNDSSNDSDTPQRSALWIEGPDGVWRNADRAARSNTTKADDTTLHDSDTTTTTEAPPGQQRNNIVILVGEELVETGLAAALQLTPALHCVRVDPMGDDLPRAHFRCDPNSAPTLNRRSAALVLRHGI